MEQPHSAAKGTGSVGAPEPEPLAQGRARAGIWEGAAFLQAPAAPSFCPYFGYCLSSTFLGISAWVEDAITTCEPAATWAQQGWEGRRGEVKGITILLPARESTAGLLHWPCEAETRGEQVLHASAEASQDHLHSWQMCWVLPPPPFPGRCQVVLGLQPALTRKEGIVQEDGPLSGFYQSFIAALGLAIVNASPWPMWDHVPYQCVRYGVSASQDPGFPSSGQR